MDQEKDTLLEFPCDFPVKIVGLSSDEFEIAAIGIMRKHFPNLGETAISHRTSKDDKYLSLTIMVTADSKAQLDAAYIELNAHELIIMTL